MNGWKYYNHALIPTIAPHAPVDTAALENGTLWNIAPKSAYFARWTSDWDCAEETQWWYVIKDEPFDIDALKSKRRYEVRKGIKFFDVSEFDYKNAKEEIYRIQLAAMRSYPEERRVRIDKERLFASIDSKWDYYKAYCARFRETGEMCGYSLLRRDGRYINFALQFAVPEYEKFGVNAALINAILTDHASFLSSGGYICDGSRAVIHETAFQDYLEKYFSFRKAYCRLHISYRKPYGIVVKLLYPFRRQLLKSKNRKIKNLCAVLQMEEAVRNG